MTLLSHRLDRRQGRLDGHHLLERRRTERRRFLPLWGIINTESQFRGMVAYSTFRLERDFFSARQNPESACKRNGCKRPCPYFLIYLYIDMSEPSGQPLHPHLPQPPACVLMVSPVKTGKSTIILRRFRLSYDRLDRV